MSEHKAPHHLERRYKLVKGKKTIWYCFDLDQAQYMSGRLKVDEIHKLRNNKWELIK